MVSGAGRSPSNDFWPTGGSLGLVRDELDAGGDDFLEESGEAWPDEPDEFDPHSLGPEVPSAPGSASGEVDASPELLKAFWSAVLFANVGLLGVSLGPMLAYFEGRTEVGLAVFLIGVLGLVFAYRRYHGYMNRDERDGEGGDAEDGHDGDTGDGTDDRDADSADPAAATGTDRDRGRGESGGGG